ncbi:MAG TPA: hypothetical protein DD473_15550 [Planctomycetaceae bacterium]|nr:hypothetical protein [Planctomycetaceae bacterium]
MAWNVFFRFPALSAASVGCKNDINEILLNKLGSDCGLNVLHLQSCKRNHDSSNNTLIALCLL